MQYKFYQYPRGVNKEGVLNTEICPAISYSSWENNCFLIEIQDGQETDDPAPKSGGQIKDGCMIDTYNQQIQYDVSCTIRTNINTANHHFILVMEEPKAVSYTRDSKGKTQNKHLNEIVNTIHTCTGSGGNTDCFVAEPIPLNPYEDGTARTIKSQYYKNGRAKFARQDGWARQVLCR